MCRGTRKIREADLIPNSLGLLLPLFLTLSCSVEKVYDMGGQGCRVATEREIVARKCYEICQRVLSRYSNKIVDFSYMV